MTFSSQGDGQRVEPLGQRIGARVVVKVELGVEFAIQSRRCEPVASLRLFAAIFDLAPHSPPMRVLI